MVALSSRRGRCLATFVSTAATLLKVVRHRLLLFSVLCSHSSAVRRSQTFSPLK